MIAQSQEITHQAVAPEVLSGRDEKMMKLMGMLPKSEAIDTTSDLTSAENEKLRSTNRALVALGEGPKICPINRPAAGIMGQGWNLQEKMGLADDRQLYLSIWVSPNEHDDLCNLKYFTVNYT